MWTGDTYREAVVRYLREKNIQIFGRWCYQFGIFTGTTFVFIYQMFRKYGLNPERILAFDSFEGLPNETQGVPRNEIWTPGQFHMKNKFQTQDNAEIINRIMSQLPDIDIPVQWFEGFFSEVLTPEFLKGGPQPAFWVDLDVDLYKSTIDVLDFMIPNGLIVPDTIISYDDWGGTAEYAGGESLAHREMCEKYGMECEEIHRYTNPPHTQIAFIVRRVSHGS